VLAAIPDPVALAVAWGLRLAGPQRPHDRVVSCHAADREDRHASAQFYRDTGWYRDYATGHSCSLFDLGVLLGNFPSWQDCKQWCIDNFP
jgi:hypothetical protein